MVEFVVTAAIAAVSSLLRKLAAVLTCHYKLLNDVRHDIKYLEDELEAMHAFLLMMSDVEEPNEQAKLRVKALRELSYDMEDKIDKFMLLEDQQASSSDHGFRELISKFKKKITEIKTRHQIAKELKDIKNQVKEVSERYKRYKIDESSSKPINATVDPRLRALYKDASDLVGIDGPRDELVKWLSNDGESAHRLKVVSIVGYGGLGKTTLAKQVYDKMGTSFEYRAFVQISRNPDMLKILSSLYSQIHEKVETHAVPEEQNIIIDQIREFLKDKRYFIVIDDIWDIPTWRILDCVLVKNSCGSRIMTTTRIIDVAKSCCASHGNLVYKIKPLGVSDSKKLFLKRIFDCEESCPSNLKEASEEILKKCGGLPLAIITISGLLATTRQTKDEWSRVRRSIGFAQGNSSDVEAMTRILSLSYFDLPRYIRNCLLYLSQYPEDYEIPRQYLIHSWIAEGFIHDEDGQDLVELGEIYFHELVNKSLVQPVNIGYDGKARHCRVHDTILDFLMYMSTEQNFCTQLRSHSELIPMPNGRIRRLSLMASGGEESVDISAKGSASHVRSIVVFGHANQLPSLLNFTCLRVMDLYACRGLENHHVKDIKRLRQLRYLNISRTGVTELPRQIGDLHCLETLIAESTMLEELPETMCRLQRLAHLFLHPKTKLPDGIGNMKNLQELRYINVFRHSLNFQQQLGKLTNLKRLHITYDTDKIEGDKASYKENLVSSLCKMDKCNLGTLFIEFYLREKDGPAGDPFFPALNSIRHVTLRGVSICSRITKWLVSLANLEILFVEIEKTDKHIIQMIGSIPSLLKLTLKVTGTVDAGPIIISGRFQQLQKFWFSSDSTGLMLEAGAMPKLVEFDVQIHPVKFRSAIGAFDFGIQHLSCLSQVHAAIHCYGVTAGDVEATECAFRSMVDANPRRPALEIRRV